MTEAGVQGPGDARAVQFDQLTKSFADLVAVDHVDLAIGEGEFFGFLGPNGAGKSTTIKMATGLLKPTFGRILVFGQDPYERPLEVKSLIGVVPEEVPLYERLTGQEALELAGRLHLLGARTARSRADDLIEWLDLQDAATSLIVDYSTGMKKKVALGCALIHKPRLLFLDEPFSGIDPVAVKGVKDVLSRMVREGVTVFFSSHVMELAEKLCTRVAILHKGRIRAAGTLPEVRRIAGLGEQASLEDVFVQVVGGSLDAGGAEWLVTDGAGEPGSRGGGEGQAGDSSRPRDRHGEP
jgi:ABC-2 type transport system ATP-binding protein